MKFDLIAESLSNEERISFYRKLLSHIPDLIFQMNISPDGNIVFPYLSKSVIEIFEVTESDFGRNPVEVLREKIIPEDLLMLRESLETVKKEPGLCVFEFRSQLPKKGLCWFRVSAWAEKDSNGGFVFYGRVNDNMDYQRKVQERKELGKTLDIVNQQNEKLLNFAHIVSHNLRSHAGNFRMLLDIMENETDEELLKEARKYLRLNSDELTETIENLKQLVEVQSDLKPDKKELNLHYYLNKVLHLLSEEFIKHNVEFKVNIPDDAEVNFNPAYMESILLNFTTNAVKYSHPDRKPRISYDYAEENGQKILSISDNGLGIDMERHGANLFGMYKTFHKHPNSRGLGLFMTKSQIESMGGKVSADSKVNVGTTFKIIFND